LLDNFLAHTDVDIVDSTKFRLFGAFPFKMIIHRREIETYRLAWRRLTSDFCDKIETERRNRNVERRACQASRLREGALR